MKRYKCRVCGEIFEVEEEQKAVCPLCGKSGDALEELPSASPVYDKTAMYKLTYGLFVLTVRQGGRDGGCVINTAGQVTSTPNRIALTVNKGNYTHEVLSATGEANVSVLSQAADFSLFRRFGFSSGRDTDKFADFSDYEWAENGIAYLTAGANAYLSVKVVQTFDLGTHTMFICDVTGGKTLCDVPSATYEYYQQNIKPKPSAAPAGGKKKTVWRCKVCGYEYEGEELPPDFICPLCKHGAEDFEKV